MSLINPDEWKPKVLLLNQLMEGIGQTEVTVKDYKKGISDKRKQFHSEGSCSWSRLPREAVKSLFLEILKTHLDKALSNLVKGSSAQVRVCIDELLRSLLTSSIVQFRKTQSERYEWTPFISVYSLNVTVKL